MSIRGRSFKVVIGSLAVGAALWAFTTFMTSWITEPANCPSRNAPCVDLIVRSSLPFTLTFRGQSYSDIGGAKDFVYHVVRLPRGQSEITGRTSADTLSVRLVTVGRAANGGILLGSLQSAEGPGASVRHIEGACRVSYAPTAGTPLPYSFRIRFDVGTSDQIC